MKTKIKSYCNLPIISYLIITVAALLGSKALFHSGYYTSHDGWHQLVRLYHLDQALADGQFPARWAGEALKGFGYPLFYFTYQIPFYLAEIIYKLGFNLWDSIKIVFVLGYLISGWTMYIFTKQLWGKWGGLISSFLYLWAPYRFSNIFVRGSLGEHFTYIFIPLIFLGLLQLSKQTKTTNIKAMIITAVGITGIILSHAIILQLMIIPLIIYGLTLLIQINHKLRFILTSAAATILGFGLSSYYFIPAFASKKIITGFVPLGFNEHFVTFKQLMYSPWGYGFSFPGEIDTMAFQVGIPQWLVLVTVILLIPVIYISRKIKPLKTFSKNIKSQGIIISLAMILITIITFYLMMEPSRHIWESLIKYITLDYPWRYLAVPTFTIAVIAGLPVSIADQLNVKKISKYIDASSLKPILITTYMLSITLLTVYSNRNHIRVNMYENNPMQFVLPEDSSNTYDEYAPRGFNMELKHGPQPDKVIITSGTGQISDLQIKSNLVTFTTQSQDELTIKINQAVYPGWNLSIDQQPLETDKNGDGLWEFTTSPGSHQIKLELKETTLNTISDSITLLSIIIVIGGLWQLNQHQKGKTKKQK